MTDQYVKLCNHCKRGFTLQQIVEEPEVTPIGMAYDDYSSSAFYLFQHDADGCGTCFTVNVRRFDDLIGEEIPRQRVVSTAACQERCITIDDLEECDQDCEFAPFRRFLLRMIVGKRRLAGQMH